MRDYELVMVVSPEVDDPGTAALVERVSRFITDRGGTIAQQEEWGVRRLSYPVQRFTEGRYLLTRFAFEPSLARDLDNNLKLSEGLIRYLLVIAAS